MQVKVTKDIQYNMQGTYHMMEDDWQRCSHSKKKWSFSTKHMAHDIMQVPLLNCIRKTDEMLLGSFTRHEDYWRSFKQLKVLYFFLNFRDVAVTTSNHLLSHLHFWRRNVSEFDYENNETSTGFYIYGIKVAGQSGGAYKTWCWFGTCFWAL